MNFYFTHNIGLVKKFFWVLKSHNISSYWVWGCFGRHAYFSLRSLGNVKDYCHKENGLTCMLPKDLMIRWHRGKESACQCKRQKRHIRSQGWIPGSGRFVGVGNGSPLQYACLENPMDREAWRAIVHEVPQSWTWLSTDICNDQVDNSKVGWISFKRESCLCNYLKIIKEAQPSKINIITFLFCFQPMACS